MFLRYIFLLLLSCLAGNSFAQVVQTNSFDYQNQLTVIEYSKNGLSVATVKFTFDKLQNRLSRTIGIAPFSFTRPFSLYGSYVSNAKIFHRATTDSIYRFVGTTDENAYSVGSFSGGLQLGDSLLILAGGYVPLRVPVSAELLTQTHHKLPLFTAALSTDIVNPSLRTNVGSISTSPTISLQLNADRNLLKYIVVRKDSSLQEINATGLQTVNYDLREGKNFVKVYYVGSGTVRDSIEKEISYVPLAAITNPTENIAKITFACDTSKFKNVLIYAGNKFLGVISQPLTDIYATKNSLLSLHTFGFERDTLIAQNRNYTVNLQSLIHTNQQKTVQFPQTVQYPLPNISVQSNGIDSVSISAKYNVNYNPLGLISVIPTTYELTKLQANSPDQLAIRAVVDIPIPNFPTNSAFYYAGIWENGVFKKIFAPQFPSRKFSIETAQQLINVDSISKTATNTKFSLFKSQAVGIVPNTDTLTITAGREINKALRNYLVIDKDSIRNDLFTRISNVSAGLTVTTNNDSIKIKVPCNTGIFRFTSRFTHDSLTVTKTYVVKVLPIENIASAVLVSTNATCPENPVKLLIANSKTDLNYVVVDSATNAHLTGLTPRLHRGNGDTLRISISLRTTKTLFVQAKNHLEFGDTTCKQIRTQKQRIIVYPSPDTLKNIYRNWCYGYKDSITLNNTNKVEISTSPSFTTFVTVGINAKFLPTHNANVARTTEIIYYIRPRTDKGCTLPAKRIIVRQNSELFRNQRDTTICANCTLSFNLKRDSTVFSIRTLTDSIRSGIYSFQPKQSQQIKFFAKDTITGCIKEYRGMNVTVLPEISNNFIDLNNAAQDPFCLNTERMILVATAATGGDGYLVYIWEKSVDKGKTWQKIPSADSVSLEIRNLRDTTYYRRIVMSDSIKSKVFCRSDTSNIAKVNFINPAYHVFWRGRELFGLENKDSICLEQRDSLVVIADPSVNIALNGIFLGRGRAVIPVNARNSGNFTIVTALAGCSSLPTRINISIDRPQIQFSTPQNVFEICKGGKARVQVALGLNDNDSTVKFEWYRNGVPFSGNLSKELGVLETNQEGTFTCKKTNFAGCFVISSPIKVEIVMPPSAKYVDNNNGTSLTGKTIRACINPNPLPIFTKTAITNREVLYEHYLNGILVAATNHPTFDALQGYNTISGWLKLYTKIRNNTGQTCRVFQDSLFIQRIPPITPALRNVPVLSCGLTFNVVGNLGDEGVLKLTTPSGEVKGVPRTSTGYIINEQTTGIYKVNYMYQDTSLCFSTVKAYEGTFTIPKFPKKDDFATPTRDCDNLIVTYTGDNLECPLTYRFLTASGEEYFKIENTKESVITVPLNKGFVPLSIEVSNAIGRIRIPIPSDSTANSVLNSCKAVVVFPNPTEAKIRLQMENNKCPNAIYLTNIQYTLYNSIGAIVREGRLENITSIINADDLASGVYMLNLTLDKQICVQKVVIAR